MDANLDVPTLTHSSDTNPWNARVALFHVHRNNCTGPTHIPVRQFKMSLITQWCTQKAEEKSAGIQAQKEFPSQWNQVPGTIISNTQVHVQVLDTSLTGSSGAGDDIFTSAVLFFIRKIIRFYSLFFKGHAFPLKMSLHLQAYSSIL